MQLRQFKNVVKVTQVLLQCVTRKRTPSQIFSCKQYQLT